MTRKKQSARVKKRRAEPGKGVGSHKDKYGGRKKEADDPEPEEQES